MPFLRLDYIIFDSFSTEFFVDIEAFFHQILLTFRDISFIDSTFFFVNLDFLEFQFWKVDWTVFRVWIFWLFGDSSNYKIPFLIWHTISQVWWTFSFHFFFLDSMPKNNELKIWLSRISPKIDFLCIKNKWNLTEIYADFFGGFWIEVFGGNCLGE